MKRIRWSSIEATERRRALARPAVRVAEDIDARVRDIVSIVRREGDVALKRLTAQLDGVLLDDLRVSDAERQSAEARVPAEARDAIATAIRNVDRFHRPQVPEPLRIETSPGVICERISRPLRAVGLYVPAGSAPLPSTAIMLAVPAAIAKCPTRVLCTPVRPDGLADPAVVHVATACGVRDIFKIGGAQAVAAMAYGTATIPKVDKIFGPGNAWVTAAKAQVAADPAGAALDMPAGPSEVMVIADSSADPRFVALDLLSQAEHGPDSHVVLLSLDEELVPKVEIEIEQALSRLGRRKIIEQALRHALIVDVSSTAEAVEVANDYAPEHLIVQTENPRAIADLIASAGSIFLGHWTPESVGDYCSGTNHVLPTYGYAKTYSGLSVTDFQRRMTVQELTPAGLCGLGPVVQTLAGLEGLDAHAESVGVRLARARAS